MKIFNNYAYTQIRIDRKLRNLIRIVCAAEGIENRRNFCEKALEYFLTIDQKSLIAPIKKGILFRVELSISQKETLEKFVNMEDTTLSRVFHTAIYSYVEYFRNNLSLAEQRLLTRAYY